MYKIILVISILFFLQFSYANSDVDNEPLYKIVFENVQIQHDGEIASIYFDYALYHLDVKSFWGKKSMLLVNTENGWKINLAIHSIR
ncbi:hypothetical protein GCM10009111_27100 [Colwellia asteriadis]|uniref:NTF2 fold domain-containing protein n=1 Tax=Colwellia asteriadis TaxID=517723 RepID=A0ABN1L9C6_9GAMM